MRPSVTPFDILLFAILALIWGTSFTFLKIALGSLPPLTVAAVRVTIGALVLLAYLAATGRRLPRGGRLWRVIAAASMAGLVLPFSLIGWGQGIIDSAVSAICMASVPLYTLPLAHLVTHDEKLTPRRVAGVVIGFVGVALLFAGKAGDSHSTALGVLAVLAGAFSYAVEGLMIRRLSQDKAANIDGIALTAALLLVASLILTPAALIVEAPWTLRPTTASALATLYLGVVGSAISMLVMVMLISRVGATITSLNNYLVPVIGMLSGVLWLDERLSAGAVAACALILLGVAVTSRRQIVS